MRFAMFFMAEYMNMITVSALAVDALPGRIPRAVPVQSAAGRRYRLLGSAVVPGEGADHALHLRLVAWHAAAAEVRPVHAVRLALVDSHLARLDAHDRDLENGPARGWFSGRGFWFGAAAVFAVLVGLAFFGGGKEEPAAEAGEPAGEFDAFAGGYPVPPMGDQVLPEFAQVLRVRRICRRIDRPRPRQPRRAGQGRE